MTHTTERRAMTVAELVVYLSGLPQSAEVWIEYDDADYGVCIETVDSLRVVDNKVYLQGDLKDGPNWHEEYEGTNE